MNCLMRALIFGLAFGASTPLAAQQLAPPQEIKQVPEAGDRQDLDSLPQVGQQESQSADVGLRAVYRYGCIRYPGQTYSYTFTSARGNNYYSAYPSRTFDVMMRVYLRGYRPVWIDRWYGGGIERFNFYSPPPRRLVTVTIAGYRGSTGCFSFSALP